MHLGYYLAQGLIPLGEHSSDDDEGPCELPDGRLVCGPHGFVVCGRCCSDYSFMDDVLDDGEDSDSEISMSMSASQLHDLMSSKRRRGTGRVLPTTFLPPSASSTPAELFPQSAVSLSSNSFPFSPRYTRLSDRREALIYTDGACLGNGGRNPRAGWAFVYGPTNNDGAPTLKSGRLECQGPFGDDSSQTSNRAELRAVIAALRFEKWADEGYNTIVIATDSEYVVEGATKWVKSWINRDWKTQKAEDVKNKDLWEMLLGEVESAGEAGLAVRLWRIPRELNELADAAAKKAAGDAETPAKWVDVFDVARSAT